MPMIPSALDLVILTGATYGWSWVITQSFLLSNTRLLLHRIPIIGELLQCIVCTGAWVGLALWFWSGLVTTPVFALLVVGWSVFACWSLARLLGDAA